MRSPGGSRHLLAVVNCNASISEARASRSGLKRAKLRNCEPVDEKLCGKHRRRVVGEVGSEQGGAQRGKGGESRVGIAERWVKSTTVRHAV